jgi:urease alpha subunit
MCRYLNTAVLFPALAHTSIQHHSGPMGVCMVCYRVLAQFAFYQHKPALVSATVKKQTAPAHLVLSCLPFGHGLKYRRFFKTEEEAAQYVSYLHTIYTNRTVPASFLSGGQLSLF